MYCSKNDLESWVLEAYLERLEQISPGLIDGMMEQVSLEIDEHLKCRFALPLPKVPATLRRIAAVLVGYRCLGAITSLMNTEAGSENDLLYIQREAAQAYKDLKEIAGGDLDIGLETETGKALQSISPPRVFSDDLLKRY